MSGFKERYLFPLEITKEKKGNHVNLLIFSHNETSHNCLNRNLSGLLSCLTKNKSKRFFCEYCLRGFMRHDLLEHELHCSKKGPQKKKIKWPSTNNNVLCFKDVQKQLKVVFVIYAGFESREKQQKTKKKST